MRPARVTTPAAERGAVVLRAKGKAGGGKGESSASERPLDWAGRMGKRAEAVILTRVELAQAIAPDDGAFRSRTLLNIPDSV